MKKILIYMSFFSALFLFTSCEKDDSSDISDITEYATFTVTGPKYLYVNQGDPYQDPGVEALEGDATLEVTTTGDLDVDTPGVYQLTYSAVNSDGFPATVTRYVAVGNKAVATSRDLSGEYAPANTVTKIGEGFYQNSDVLPANGIAVFMVDLGDGSIVVPPQSSPFGVVVADPSVNPDTFGVLNSEDSFSLTEEIGPNGIFEITFNK